MSKKREYLNNRISEMSELQDGWISGAYAIKPAIIIFSKSLVENLDDNVLEHIDIGPFINGSVIVSYRNDEILGAINIAFYSLSGFIEAGKDYKTLELHYSGTKEMNNALSKVTEFIKQYG